MIASIAILLAAAALAGGQAAGEGHDAFDRIADMGQFRDLESELVGVAARGLPAVVNLRSGGGRGASTGSGVVITPDGLVATCGHFGRRAGRAVTATLADGTEIRGRTLGQADVGKLDCGLVQLDVGERRLACASLGNSGTLEPGDWVVTVGYTQGPPDGEARPALVRCGRVLRSAPEELLLDAPIDAGDSGGPAFDLRGDVVAINTRCGRQSWQNAATPIDRLRERMPDFTAGLDESNFTVRVDEDDEDVGTDFARAHRSASRRAVQAGLPLAEVSADALASTVRIVDRGRHVAYGTVIDDRGRIVTKRSELPAGAEGDAVALLAPDGRTVDATVLGFDGALDLAVLDAGDCGIPPVRWARSRALRPGQVLITPRFGDDGPALGFAGIARRESPQDISSRPYLGVMSEFVPVEAGAAGGARNGMRVDEVVSGSGADRAGLRVGDVILRVDGAALDSRMALRQRLGERSLGERVWIDVLRDGERLELAAELGLRPGPMGREPQRGNTMTPISRRSAGLGTVLAHDAAILPIECGGPVVDLDGDAVGINIARYDRTATHALDPKTVMKASERIIRESARTREAGSAPR